MFRQRARLGLVTIVGLVMLAVTAGSATAAPFGHIGNGPLALVESTDAVVRMPQTVMSSNGDATIFWQRQDLLNDKWTFEFAQVDAHLAADPQTSPTGFDSTSTVQPDPLGVAAGPNGSSAIAQHYFDGSNWRIRVARVNGDGVIGTGKSISDAKKDSTIPLIALAANGNGVVAWLTDETGIGGWVLHWCTYSAAGATGPVQSANAKTTTIAGSPSLSISPAGVATLAFRLRDVAKNKYSLQAIRISAVGKVAKALTVVPLAAGLIDDLNQATAANGSTAIAWVNPLESGTNIRVAMVSAANVVKTTTGFSGSWPGATKPKVAVSSTGAAAVVWQEEGPAATQINAARVSTTAAVSTRRLLTSLAYDSFDPAISSGNDGSALITWTRFPLDLEGPPINGSVRYSTRGGLSKFEELNSGVDQTAGSTSSAATASGRVVIASQTESPSGSSIDAWCDF